MKSNGAENSLKLLGVEINNKFNFNNHILNICKKAGNEINIISRIQSFLGQKNFSKYIFYSNFNCCLLVWHFSTKKSTNKIKKKSRTLLKITRQQHY